MIKNIVLAAVLVIQVAVWFIIDSPLDTESAKSDPVERHKLADIDLARIAAIEVSDPSGESLRLTLREQLNMKARPEGAPPQSEQQDSIWVIDNVHGFPATQKKVLDALQELAGFSASDFRTNKRFLHEDLEVDDAKGQHIKLLARDNTILAHIIVGKRDVQGARGTFVRMADENAVYVAKSQQLGSVFSTQPRVWFRPGMMDVALTDQEKMAELRSGCHKIVIEAKIPKKGEDGRPVDPPVSSDARYVYERAQSEVSEDVQAQVFWKVTEPEGLSELKLDDLMVRPLVTSMLNVRATEIVGAGNLEKYELGSTELSTARITCYFMEGEVETSRSLEIGGEKAVAENPGGRPAQAMRFARVQHPGQALRQNFVFTVPTTFTNYYTREPSAFVRKTPNPPR